MAKKKIDKRNKCILFRFTENERLELEKSAAQMGVSVSQYVRTRIFKSEVSTINAVEFLKVYREQVHELKKIGNNINQLTRYANYIEEAGQVSPQIIEEMNKYLCDFIVSQRETYALNKKILKA